MATTTNYSWSTPDDTALVKDGAAAIRTLGSSADTTVKALNPGTTAGDVDYYTTSTAKARIGIGTAGQVLTVNSGATAPEWTTISAGGMTLINTGGTTLTGSSVVISSIPTTYVNLFVVVRNFLPATDDVELQMRFNNDSAANRHFRNTVGAESTNSTYAATLVGINQTQDNGTGTGLVQILFPDYANTTTMKFATSWSTTNNASTPSTQFGIYCRQLFYNQTSAITSLSFFPSSGNFTSGTVFVYGVK